MKITYKIDRHHPFVVFASWVILVASVTAAVFLTGGLVILSLVLHPVLTKLGKHGMWRRERGKLILTLDAKAFQKVEAF